MLAARRSPVRLRLFAVAVLALAVAPVARAQVLDLVPSDAAAVVKVKNIGAVSTKAAKLFTDLGLVALKPELADPLGHIEEQSGIKNGINRDGDVAIVVMTRQRQGGGNAAPGAEGAFNDTDTAHAVILAQDQEQQPGGRRGARRGGPGGMGQPSGMVLIPVSDYKAFLSNFDGAQELDNGLTQVTIKNNPRPQYVAHWGNYAAVSPDKSLVSAKPDGLKPSAVAAKELDAKDVTLFVNTPELKKTLLPMLQSRRGQIMDQLKAKMANDPAAAKFGSVITSAVGKYLDLAESVLRDSNGAVISLNLTDSAVNFAALSDFAEGTPAAQTIAKLKNSDQSLLAGIPAGKYIFYGGYQIDPQITAEFMQSFVGPMLEAMKQGNAGDNGGVDAAAITKAVEAAKKSALAVKSASFAIAAPRAAIGTESLFQGFMVVHGDAKAYTEANREYFSAINNVLTGITAGSATNPPAGNDATKPDAAAPANGAPAAKPAIKMSGDVKENAKTLDGVTFDQFTLHVSADPSTPQGAQAQQAMAMMYGPGGLNYYSGAVNDNTALLIFGGNDALITKAITGAKANDTALVKQPNVQTADSQLPPNRFATGYFALDELVTTVVTYAKQFGLPANVQLPPDLPPIAAALSTDTTAIRGDLTVPTQLIQSITAAVLQTMQQMQGGGAGGPGGNPGGL